MHIRQTVNPVYNREWARALVAGMKAGGTPLSLDGGKIGLFQAGGVEIAPSTTLANIEAAEADFTDYARKTAVWEAPVNLSLSVTGLVYPAQWLMVTDPVVDANDIGGWFATNSDESDWVIAETFDVLVPMGSLGDKLHLLAALPFMFFQTPAGNV